MMEFISSLLGVLAFPATLLWQAIVFTYQFLLLYILVMGVYRAHLDQRLTPALRVLLYPAVALGFAVDLLANWTVATVWFREWPTVDLSWPPRRPDLVTTRLSRYLAADYPPGRNKKHAGIICRQLLDPFDPNPEGHCNG
ncbi:MAG: hypothetical protein Q7U28_08005 [Aquabacterium sp.]|nr:hypothetical protein [Aquabacterium sp.]